MVTINILVKSSSKLDKIEVVDRMLHVKIKARPVDGEANEYLTKYLARTFDVSRSSVEIIKGLASKHKTISMEINSLEFEEKLAKLD